MSNASVGRRFIFYPAPLFLLRGLRLFWLFRLLIYFPSTSIFITGPQAIRTIQAIHMSGYSGYSYIFFQQLYFYYWASGYLDYSYIFSSNSIFITGPQANQTIQAIRIFFQHPYFLLMGLRLFSLLRLLTYFSSTSTYLLLGLRLLRLFRLFAYFSSTPIFY